MAIEVLEGTEVAIRRGYVKWTDPEGVFHKEPLVDHPDLLATASAQEQLQAEEARRLNESAELAELSDEADAEAETLEVLEELKKATDDIITAAQLDETAFDSAIEERTAQVHGEEPATVHGSTTVASGAEDDGSGGVKPADDDYSEVPTGSVNVEAGSITPGFVRREADEE